MTSALPVYSPDFREPPLATHIARSEPRAMPGSKYKSVMAAAHRLRIEAMEKEVDEILDEAGNKFVKIAREIIRRGLEARKWTPKPTQAKDEEFVELKPTLPESPQKQRFVGFVKS